MTFIKRMGLVGLVAASAATLGGCYDDYGYGGVEVGYGPGYATGYDGYYDGYYGEPGYAGYGYPGYYGWYGGYYYPGSGLYVYDRYRRSYRWNDDQRRYWGGQQRAFRDGERGEGYRSGANWGGFRRSGGERPAGQAFRGGSFRGGGVSAGGGHGGYGGGRHR